MPSLEDLANEVIDAVLGFLAVNDLCSLRLVNRAISEKATKRVFREVRLDLALGSLKSFEEATSEFLGQHIRNLTLVGIVSDHSPANDVVKSGGRYVHRFGQPGCYVAYPEEEMAEARRINDILSERNREWRTALESGEVHALLCRSFEHIANKSRQQCLDRLSLEIQIVHDPDKGPTLIRDTPQGSRVRVSVLGAAAFIHTLAIQSLQQSGLTLRALDIYTSDPASDGCSLPVDMLAADLMEVCETRPLPFESLRQLTISFTDPLLSTDKEADATSLQAEILQLSHSFGVTKLLKLCPNVEDLHIERSGLVWPASTPAMMEWCRAVLLPQQIRHITEHVRLPRLRKLRVSGLDTTAADLAELFKTFRDTLEHVELVHIHLHGPLSVALSLFTDGMCPNLKSWAVQEILEDGRRVEPRSASTGNTLS